MMKNIDYLSLDGRSLYMIKLIHEHRSVTEAARLLGVTQSSVSHSLDRLRSMLGDPLFLKVGARHGADGTGRDDDERYRFCS